MGEVYRARDARLNRDVAIKILPASFSRDPERLQRFAQESRAAAALSHPNILSIYDIGETEGAPYVVSELLEGETLRDRMARGPIPWRKAIEIAVPLADGLAAREPLGLRRHGEQRVVREQRGEGFGISAFPGADEALEQRRVRAR